ncbi:MAG: S9 family peptidase [Saprospirales bacterium]|nr:MAG: S9 family peptidase [Saprospirales bacterium]
MKTIGLLVPAGLLIFAVLFTMGACTEPEKEEVMTMKEQVLNIEAPVANKKPVELEKHGDVRMDNYYWLNDREDEEVIDYLKLENEYLDKVMAHTADLQENLFQEIVGRIKQDDESVPYLDNGYYYYTRYESGKEHPIYCRKKGSLDAAEEVVLNVNELAEKYEYYNVTGLSVSPDNRFLAFGEDTLSRRIFNIRIKDLETGEFLPDYIPATTGSSVWSADGSQLFYNIREPETLRAYKVFRHELGTNTDEDVLVFHEEDNTFLTFLYKTKSRKYIVVGSYATLTQEYRLIPAADPTAEPRVFQPRDREGNLEYSIAHIDDKFYIRTNLNARNFKIMVTVENATGKENWRDFIPHREDVLVENMELFNDYLVVQERIQGLTQMRVMEWEGEEHYIEFDDEAYVVYPAVNRELDTDLLRIGYSSLTTPNSTYDYNMRTRELTLLKQQEVIGDFDPENYVSRRKMVKVRDGVEVPVSMVFHKNTPLDGSSPLLLYGYGSYGYSMEPFFSSIRLSLLDRGFIYVIAHIRGGEEMGRHWYEDGKLLNKKNTFYDFIDCGKYLVKNKYADPNRLYAMGGSAGGLLMGAVVNMEPDLWSGIIAAVPFVDVVTTMLDESIPLTTGEYDEWGNPNVEEYYHYIKSYSPYDNVEAKDYPPMLVTTGLHDSQVQYWEPAKWVARMRELKTDDNPLLLYTNLSTGHSGAAGRFERHRETARNYAFLLDLAGITE